MATLLMDEYPLMVSPWLAKEIGLNEAIFLQQLRFWESKNMGRVDEDGRRWIYNSIPAWLQQFPFLSERTLKRVLTNLESKGLLLTTTRFNRPADRTKSYAINEDMLLVYDERYMAEKQLRRKKVAAEKNAVHDFLSAESSSERKSQSVPTIVPNWHDAENQGSEEFLKEKGQSVLTNVSKWHDGKCHFGTLDEEAVNPDAARLQGISSRVRLIFRDHPLRDLLDSSRVYPLDVARTKALAGAWYEIFPRSAGAFQRPDGTWVSGTLAGAAKELPRIAGMGFDVVYLTPVHPIGTTNRKGRNNTLVAKPGDPGSPYAIGSSEGGHDAIHPELGTFKDFDYFVKQAKRHGMEVALDVALQCSPDHPWLTEHPEWFTARADGTIAYAENPPKKYQDIYPLNFDNDPEGIYREIKRILELWVSHGVTIFRVDNPHTKPLAFWQRLLSEFRTEHPDVLFLAEAFTAPPMLQGLGAAGFHQSYTYFAWRTEKKEIEDYLWELARQSDDRVRPAFWPTTHDILTPYMQRGGLAAFSIRAVLAATGSPTWGIYSGYELVENIARPGAEEQVDNEKYEFKVRDWKAAEYNGIAHLLGNLNAIRSRHTALRRLREIVINPTSNDKVISFTRYARPEETPDGKPDAVITVLNLDPYATRDAEVYLDLGPFGVFPRWDGGAILEVTDELSGQTFRWNEHPYVRLDPRGQCAHILSAKAL